MSKVIIVALLAVLAAGCAPSRNDGFDWGDKRVLDCIGAAKC